MAVRVPQLLTLFCVMCVRSREINDLSGCKTYSNHGRNHIDFFPMPEAKLLHFYVKGPSDAHITLSRSDHYEISPYSYTVVLGIGEDNKNSVIRSEPYPRPYALTLDQFNDTLTNDSVLSPEEFRHFWIHILSNDTILVGYGGRNDSFLQWNNPNHFDYRYFSFVAWDNVTLEWLYDCPEDNQRNHISPTHHRALHHGKDSRNDYEEYNTSLGKFLERSSSPQDVDKGSTFLFLICTIASISSGAKYFPGLSSRMYC